MPSPLVDVAWLAAHAADEDVRVVDCRWYLVGKRGEDAYAAGHLPGASFAHLERDLASPPGSGPGRHPLPTAFAFAGFLARVGVGERTQVVAYDDAGGAIAARLWWLLRWVGHDGGRVLDGGIQAWVASGGALTTVPGEVAPAPRMALRGGQVGVVDRAAVDALRRSGDASVLLDARARDRYDGVTEPVDARPGHIPGARSAPFAENLASPSGPFLPREALEARYRSLGAMTANPVVAYCGSGVTACHDLLALALVGRPDALLYEGSWSDWASDPSLPAETNSRDKAAGRE